MRGATWLSQSHVKKKVQNQAPKHHVGPFTYTSIIHHPQGALSRADTEQRDLWTYLEPPGAVPPVCSDFPPLCRETILLSIILIIIHDIRVAFLEAEKHV